MNLRKLLAITVSGLAFTGCATMQADEQQAIQSAAGSPPGYYPGLEEPVSGIERPDWQRWINANMAGIRDIADKEKQIKSGQLTPGCIGRDVNTCISTLAQTLAMADYYPVSRLFGPDKVDVNGNKLFEHVIFISGFLPEEHNTLTTSSKITFDIRLGNDRLVQSVTVSLPKDPFFARTQSEYNATGFYEVIAALGRSACPNLTKHEAALFIENQVKPKATLRGEETTCDPASGCITGNINQVKHVQLCGQTMNFYSGYGNASDLATVDNQHGAFGGMSVTFQ